MGKIPIAKNVGDVFDDPEHAPRAPKPPFPVMEGLEDTVEAFAEGKESDELLEVRSVVNGVHWVYVKRPFAAIGRIFFLVSIS